MDTRVSQFAARLVETGWLAAVIVVPVFFNVWSNRVFEPDKLTLLRSIALVMVLGLVVWLVERGAGGPGGRDVRGWLATPMVLPVLVLTAVYALATATSIVPRLSLMGSYQRLQGLYTWLAYIALFSSLVVLLRRRGQLERLVDAIVVASLPVALYGVIQNRGLDPMPWLGDVTFRVASTMGNSIFVAAFVVMVVPLTVMRVWESMRSIDAESDSTERSRSMAAVFRAAAYMVLLFVQIVCLVLSQSRGPWLGLGGGLFAMGLFAAAMRPDLRSRRRYTSLVFVGLGLLPATALLAFNLAPEGGALDRVREAPYIGRLGQVLETEGGTGKVRVLIWQGAIDLVTSDPLRMLIGYGPESMHVAYNPYYPPDLAHYESRNASPDRSHNETLDALVTTGVVGFLAYLALFTSLFAYALRWLGLIDSKRERNLFLAFWVLGGVLAVAAFTVLSGDWTYFGVALPAGMIGGLLLYVFVRSLAGWPVPERAARPIVLAITAALVAHFIEIHFGIAIASTRTLFFALMGALVVLGGLGEVRPALLVAGDVPAPAAAPAQRPRRARRAAREAPVSAKPGLWASSAFVMAVLLVTMAFDFLVRGGFDDVSAARLQELMVLAWLFSLTWAVGSLVLGSQAVLGRRGSLDGLWRYVAISLGVPALYALGHQLVLAGSDAAGGAGTTQTLLVFFYLSLLAAMLGWAWVLTRLDPPAAAPSRVGAVWVYPLVAVAVLALALFTNVNEVRADILYKEGWAGYHARANQSIAQGDLATARTYFDMAVRSYDGAVGLDGSEDYYLLFKGKALLERADAEASALDQAVAESQAEAGFSEYADATLADLVANRDQAFERAVTVLRQALAVAPRNTDHSANLGRAFQVWGERTYDDEERAGRLAESVSWFEKAIELSPNNAGLRTELATSLFLAGDRQASLQRIEEAVKLDELYGRPYRLRATLHREDEDWPAAEADYRAYVETRDGRGDAVGWSGLAYVLGQQGETEAAIEANEKVLELAGPDLSTLRNLVLLYRDNGDVERACAYAEDGLAAAPDDAGLLQLQAQLGCRGAAAPAPEAPEPASVGPAEGVPAGPVAGPTQPGSAEGP